MKTIKVKDITIGDNHPVLIGGPCLAESLEMCKEVAEKLQNVCSTLAIQYVFKASFDKANRTGARSPRGEGIEAGLEILLKIKQEFGLPVTTDVHLPDQAKSVAEVADILQVPAFLCRQTDLLEACAKTGKVVNVKKGQFLAPWDAKNIVQKLESCNANGIILTERGTSFGYNNLVVDMAGLPIMREFGWPICFDATHSAQRPGAGGSVTGGARESIPYLAAAAVAVGVDALFMEVHPDPKNAMSDAATQLPLNEIEGVLRRIAKIWKCSVN